MRTKDQSNHGVPRWWAWVSGGGRHWEAGRYKGGNWSPLGNILAEDVFVSCPGNAWSRHLEYGDVHLENRSLSWKGFLSYYYH